MDSPPARPELLADIDSTELLDGLTRLHSMVAVSDELGRIRWTSDAFAETFGARRSLIGLPLGDALSKSSNARERIKLLEQVGHVHRHLRSEDSLHDIRLDVAGHGENARYFDISAFRMNSSNGEPMLVSIVRKQAQQRAQALVDPSELRILGAVLDAIPDGVLALDPVGIVSYANPAITRILERAPGELVGQPIGLVLRAPELLEMIDSLANRAENECREVAIERTNGDRIWLSVNARTCDAAGAWQGAQVLFVRDDTERVLERQALERKNAELESYVHSVSHDLRSPLVSLVGFTRLLRQDYDEVLGETGRHFADRIEQAARTMEMLINDLLELSRIGVGNEVRTLVDPRAVLVQLHAELKLRLDANGSTLRIPEDPPLLLCDRTRLYQLFSNLVGNALQHMGDCNDRSIEVEVVTLADHHLITVTDHGHGIPESEHDHVFEVFRSTDRSGGERHSTGVGLAIVRKIAETHGGRAWVESTPGRGARFAVSLPRR